MKLFFVLIFVSVSARAQLHVTQGSQLYLEKDAFIAVYGEVQQDQKITGAGPVLITDKNNFKLILIGTEYEKPLTPDLFTGFSVYPNPAHTVTNLRIFLLQPTRVNININDAAGKRISSQLLFLRAGENLLRLNLAGMIAGTYSLTLESPIGKLSRQIIIN